MPRADQDNATPPGRKNDPEGLRARILDAAFDLFQLGGYRGTSLADIAGRAETTLGALHHHFRTKQALGTAVIEDRVAPELEANWLKPLREGVDLREFIHRHFNALADALDAQGHVKGCPIGNLSLELALTDPALRAPLDALFKRWAQAIETRLPDGPVPKEDAAALVVAGYTGAMAMAKAEQRGEPMRGAARTLCAILPR